MLRWFEQTQRVDRADRKRRLANSMLRSMASRWRNHRLAKRPAVPAPAARPAVSGAREQQQKLRSATRSYLSNGNAAISSDWSEF